MTRADSEWQIPIPRSDFPGARWLAKGFQPGTGSTFTEMTAKGVTQVSQRGARPIRRGKNTVVPY
jgi:hypothetical protein